MGRGCTISPLCVCACVLVYNTHTQTHMHVAVPTPVFMHLNNVYCFCAHLIVRSKLEIVLKTINDSIIINKKVLQSR